MPPPPTPTDQAPLDQETAETAAPPSDVRRAESDGGQLSSDPNAPLSFVPHAVDGSLPAQPTLIRTGRYGVLEEHELIRLLGDIEDERARSRFRESIYFSILIWVAIAWVVLYGPRYLWHAPKLILPSEVLRQQALTRLEAPTLNNAPTARSAPAARTAPRVDNRTLEHLRAAEPKPAVRTPAETPRAPAPATLPPSERPNLPAPSAPQPSPARPAPPVVAETPKPQPSTRPDFTTGGSAGQNIQSAIEGAARNRGGGGGGGTTARGGSGKAALGTGVEILSDTQGVNFDPYLRRILRQIYDQWIILLPEEVNPPLSKQGSTLVRFSILPDGNIGSMNLDGSTHDSALNKAAWGSITSVGQFPPLPKEFHGPKLELRINYLVNQKDGQ